MRGPARLLAVLAACALLTAHAAEAKRKKKPAPILVVPRPPDPWRVTIATADGVALAASWRPVSGVPGAPAVLLVHEFSRDRREWDALAPELNARGLATLAIDLRGHGESLRKSGLPVKLTPRLLTDPNGFPRDVEAACRWLRQRAPRVGIAGLSVGANLTVLATGSGWADAGVALSASTERFASLAGILPTTPHATLLIASEDDPGRAAAARDLNERAGSSGRLLLVPGAAHNLALFTEHPETKVAAYAWLVESLGAVPPSGPTMSAAPTPTASPAPTPAVTVTPTP